MARRAPLRREPTMAWTILRWALIGAFFLAESVLRTGSAARSTARGPADRRSTVVVGVANGLALLIPALGRPRARRRRRRWLGLGLAIGGLALRAWAVASLGTAYTRTLR